MSTCGSYLVFTVTIGPREDGPLNDFHQPAPEAGDPGDRDFAGIARCPRPTPPSHLVGAYCWLNCVRNYISHFHSPRQVKSQKRKE